MLLYRPHHTKGSSVALLPILQDGAAVLRRVARPVNLMEIPGPMIRGLVADMTLTMSHAHGIGLAAPQVGHGIRLVIMGNEHANDRAQAFPFRVLFNPILVSRTVSITQRNTEGCLSLPEVVGDVTRPLGIEVQYLDGNGQTQRARMSGFEAACLQHEIDHLDGVLFIDKAERIRPRQRIPS